MSGETPSGTSAHQRWILWGLYLTSVVTVLFAFGVLAGGFSNSSDGRFGADNAKGAFNAKWRAGFASSHLHEAAKYSGVEEVEWAFTSCQVVCSHNHFGYLPEILECYTRLIPANPDKTRVGKKMFDRD
jgi:hypothetical protein